MDAELLLPQENRLIISNERLIRTRNIFLVIFKTPFFNSAMKSNRIFSD
jgi:hypothetical protein